MTVEVRDHLDFRNLAIERNRGLADLTRVERAILEAIACGKSNKEIAADRWVSLQTVKFHTTSIFRKLGVSNRTAAAAIYLEGQETVVLPALCPHCARPIRMVPG